MTPLQKNEHLLNDLTQKLLSEAEAYHKEHGDRELLQNLHSIYGETLEHAFDILDRGKVVEYLSEEETRHVYVVTARDRRFVLFDEVNFCFCGEFEEAVLRSRRALACRHVLAVKFAKIVGRVLTDGSLKRGMFAELLNGARIFADEAK